MTDRAFLTAAEAAAALGVQRATLYAYVSRGLLRSQDDPHGRGRRYPAAEVAALRRRVAGHRDPAAVARGALAWGVPVLDSALTLITAGRLYYRGHDVADLARRGETLERIAALLWLGSLDAPLPGAGEAGTRPPGPPAAARSTAAEPARRGAAAERGTAIEHGGWGAAAERPGWGTAVECAIWAGRRPFERMLARLPLATLGDPAAYDLRPTPVVAAGTRLLSLLAEFAAGPATEPPQGPNARRSASPGKPTAPASRRRASAATAAGRAAAPGAAGRTATILARAWLPTAADDEAAVTARLIDAALVLSADHELNASAFTARCVASARAPLAAVVLAGLAALSGSRHGGYSDRVEAFLAQVAPPPAGGRNTVAARGDGQAALRDRLADRLRRGEEIPGFGHPLYPDGDPRGRLLLDLAAAHRPLAPAAESALALAAAAHDLLGEHPSLDFGLVTLARALSLPTGAPLALFAVGRTAGWIAHALEQYNDPALIRPRARYTGPAPG